MHIHTYEQSHVHVLKRVKKLGTHQVALVHYSYIFSSAITHYLIFIVHTYIISAKYQISAVFNYWHYSTHIRM